MQAASSDSERDNRVVPQNDRPPGEALLVDSEGDDVNRSLISSSLHTTSSSPASPAWLCSRSLWRGCAAVLLVGCLCAVSFALGTVASSEGWPLPSFLRPVQLQSSMSTDTNATKITVTESSNLTHGTTIVTDSSPPIRVSPLIVTPEPAIPAYHSLNTYRVLRLMEKLERGLPLMLGVVGGSNSIGYSLERAGEQVVYNRLAAWLNVRFPSLHSHGVRNHARPGTQSAFTSWCLEDVIPHINGFAPPPGSPEPARAKVDLLFVEFSANDGMTGESEMTGEGEKHSVHANMERLVRRVLTTTDSTAVFFVYFARRMEITNTYMEVDKEHELVALKYGIPSVNFRTVLEYLEASPVLSSWLEDMVNSTRRGDQRPPEQVLLMWDKAHANAKGHYLMFELIRHKLQSLWEQLAAVRTNSSSSEWSESIRALPLPPPVVESLRHELSHRCRILPGAKDDQEGAAELLQAVDISGWQYMDVGRGKRAFLAEIATCDARAGTSTGCSLSFRVDLPVNVRQSNLSVQQPAEVSVFITRSWQNWSDCWAWMWCSAAPWHHSAPTVLTSHWSEQSTQMAAIDIWPTPTFRSPASDVASTVEASTHSLFIPSQPGDMLPLQDMPCTLDRVTVWHKTPGVFQLRGVMVA